MLQFIELFVLCCMFLASIARGFVAQHASNALSKRLRPGATALPSALRAADFSSWEKWEYGTFPKYPPQQQTEEHSEGADIGWSSGFELAISQLTPEQVNQSLTVLADICNTERLHKLQQVVAQRVIGKRVVYEKPANPNNAWAALRTLDSFGIQHVDLIADTAKDNPKRWRHMHASLGTQKWLTLTEHDDTTTCLQRMKDQGFKIYVTDVHNHSKPIDKVEWAPRSAIVFGNEFHGVSAEAKALADQSFFIPMRGFAESLNLAAATAVTCSFLSSSNALPPDMPTSMQAQLLLAWVAKSVPGSLAILRRNGIPINERTVHRKVLGFTTR